MRQRLAKIAPVVLCALAVTATGVAVSEAAAPRPAASLEARLQAAEDYQEIQKLLGRYMTAVDSSDWTGYANIFSSKGELIFQSNHWTGPEEIKAGMSRAPARPAGAPVTPPRQLRHTLTNIDIELTGPDRAKGTARWITMSKDANDRPVVGATGYYDDTYVRENGQWKVLRRVIYADFPFDDPIANLAKAGKPVPK